MKKNMRLKGIKAVATILTILAGIICFALSVHAEPSADPSADVQGDTNVIAPADPSADPSGDVPEVIPADPSADPSGDVPEVPPADPETDPEEESDVTTPASTPETTSGEPDENTPENEPAAPAVTRVLTRGAAPAASPLTAPGPLRAPAAPAAPPTVTIEGITYDENTFEIQLDGKVVPYTKYVGDDGEITYTITVNEDSQIITVVQYYINDTPNPRPEPIYDTSGNHKDFERDYTDDSKPYPEHMAVWKVKRNYTVDENDRPVYVGIDGTAERILEFDDILTYEGFALKQPSNINNMSDGGLRVSFSIPKSIKRGIKDAENNPLYTISEYGLLHIFSRNWNAQSRDHMTVNDQLVEQIASYKAGSGGFDHELTAKSDDNKSVFSNYLYNLADYNSNKYFRVYLKFHDHEHDKDYILYGPIVGRNPYYVALNYQAKIDSNPNRYDAVMKKYVETILGNVTSAGDRVCRVFFIGDSIMMGQTLKSGGSSQNKPSDYTQVSKPPSVLIGNALAGRFKAANIYDRVECTLIANGGATYSEPGVNRRNMPDLAALAMNQGVTPNFIFLLAGVNDWAYVDQGEYGFNNTHALFGENHNGVIKVWGGQDYEDDDFAYCVGVDRTIKKLVDEYDDDGTKIIVCSPLRAFWAPSGPGTTTVNAATGETLSSYSHVQKCVSEKYNTDGKDVYFINLYDLMRTPMGLPTADNTVPERHSNFSRYFPDGVHPNQSGYNKICQIILDTMHNTRDHDNNRLIPAAP